MSISDTGVLTGMEHPEEEYYVENFQGQIGFLGKCLTNTNQNPVCCGATGMQLASFISNQSIHGISTTGVL